MNKNFHSRINFSSNILSYDSIRERIEAKKIDDIVNRMQELLKFDQCIAIDRNDVDCSKCHRRFMFFCHRQLLISTTFVFNSIMNR